MCYYRQVCIPVCACLTVQTLDSQLPCRTNILVSEGCTHVMCQGSDVMSGRLWVNPVHLL